MEFWDEAIDRLVKLNVELDKRGDPARIRYARFEPDPYLDDEWVVHTVWELPEPDPGDEVWPLKTTSGYRMMLHECFRDNPWLSASALFRTADELQDAAHRRGQLIPA